MKPERIQDIKEKLLVGAVFTGIFLPARVFFFTYISQYWLGSFGLISGIAGGIFILAYKNKLGVFGRIWMRQIVKISRGKIGIFLIGQAIFGLSVYAGYIYFIEEGRTTYAEDIMFFEQFLNQNNLTAYTLLADTNLDDFETGANAIVDTAKDPKFQEVIFDPEQLHFLLSMSFYIANSLSEGWILHFNLVFVVEQTEQLLILLYFKFFYKRGQTIKV